MDFQTLLTLIFNNNNNEDKNIFIAPIQALNKVKKIGIKINVNENKFKFK